MGGLIFSTCLLVMSVRMVWQLIGGPMVVPWPVLAFPLIAAEGIATSILFLIGTFRQQRRESLPRISG